MFDSFLLAFIPMFFAMDAIGVLAIFAALTNRLNRAEKRKIIAQSILTATALAVVFIFLGKIIFDFLGITMADFMVAGGVILFCLAIADLLSGPMENIERPAAVELGAVPLGTPLIVGPAVLTMALMSLNQFGWAITLGAVLANLAIVALVFLFSERLLKIIGASGSRALSKVVYLLLAAVGVMLVRKGIFEIIHAAGS